MAPGFIYCVHLMDDRGGTSIYLLCAHNGREEWNVDLSIVCP